MDPGHTQTPYATEVGPLSPSPECWDHRHLPPCPATGKLLGWLYFLLKSVLWYSLIIMSLLRFLCLRYFWRLCFSENGSFSFLSVLRLLFVQSLQWAFHVLQSQLQWLRHLFFSTAPFLFKGLAFLSKSTNYFNFYLKPFYFLPFIIYILFS